MLRSSISLTLKGTYLWFPVPRMLTLWSAESRASLAPWQPRTYWWSISRHCQGIRVLAVLYQHMDCRVMRPLGPWTLYWGTSESTWVGLVLCTGLTMMMLWYPQWTELAPGLSLTSSLAGTMFIPPGSSYLLSPWPSYLSDRRANVAIYLAPWVCCRPASLSLHSSEANRGGGHLEVPSLTTNITPGLSAPSISPLYLLSRAPRLNNRTFPRKVRLHQSYMFFGAYYFLLSLVNPIFFMKSWPTWAPVEQSEPTTSPEQQHPLGPASLAIHPWHPQGNTKKMWGNLSLWSE